LPEQPSRLELRLLDVERLELRLLLFFAQLGLRPPCAARLALCEPEQPLPF